MFSYFAQELQITGTEQDNAALFGEKWGVKCIQRDSRQMRLFATPWRALRFKILFSGLEQNLKPRRAQRTAAKDAKETEMIICTFTKLTTL